MDAAKEPTASPSNGPSVSEVMYESSTEQLEPQEAVITGAIPNWLHGSFLRIGPGKFEWGEHSYKHWFDGEGLLHGFQIADGKVTFASRFVQSMSYLESQKIGCPAYSQFGTVAPPDPCKNIFARFFSYFIPPEMTDNCNVNVVSYGKDILATTESTKMWCIDPRTLETKKPVDVGKIIGEPRTWTAHPHYEVDGTSYNVSTLMTSGQIECVATTSDFESSTDSSKEMKVIGTFPGNGEPGYYHSFGITENFVVLLENPVFFGHVWKIFAMKVMDWSYRDLMQWDPEKKTKVTVINKKNGELIRTIYFKPAFVFHHVNCYEEEDQIVMDVCGYSDASVLNALYLHDLRRSNSHRVETVAEFRRYCFSTARDVVTEPFERGNADYEVIKVGFELPRINYAFNGKKYRFAYGIGSGEIAENFTKIVKVDVEMKTSTEWQGDNCFPSEPVFVPSPDALEEDDGVVLSSVLGVNGTKSFLLILDARTFNELGRAYVDSDLRPLVHGVFITG